MWRFLLIPSFLFAAPTSNVNGPPVPPSLSLAAEYYYNHHDYPEALRLWNEVVKKDPTNTMALLKILELKLLIEGHTGLKAEAVKFLEANERVLSHSDFAQIQGTLKNLQETFVTDDGQSNYLQAIPKMDHADYAGALRHLNQALNSERGHLRVFKRRATCEKKLGMADRFYQSAKGGYELCPFDRDAREQWVEALVYYKEFDTILGVLRTVTDSQWSSQERLHYGLALLETGRGLDALRVLRGVSGNTSPVLWYALGKIYMARPGFENVGLGFWQRFSRATQFQFEAPNVVVWDPYQIADKRAEAAKAIAAAHLAKDVS